jgi:hypothetical protein
MGPTSTTRNAGTQNMPIGRTAQKKSPEAFASGLLNSTLIALLLITAVVWPELPAWEPPDAA